MIWEGIGGIKCRRHLYLHISYHIMFVCSMLTYLNLMAALTNMANKFNRGGAHIFDEETRTEEQQKIQELSPTETSNV